MPTSGLNAMSEQKLKKMLEQNNRLREQLDLPRVPVSQASQMLIKYVSTTRDYLVPSVWGTPGANDPFANKSGGCECTIL
ncbi:guanine nucleotide-binding protein subunit gamma [Basidiobolus meristosporus CBS 931.73]|uniref:Guanine nucleotide-binding protein subunit gamma n=1 Tax=Basidiobolus meristosporus CBS 931.73 TaxID=1314790 RepID=A0A1Y1YN58_9FUNG|nr:guanine nucleotide-binding protein subunit gamma [Basidiobolus meristosporus CBS 931.73]|eukprot:ORX99273.1 guanine nucleotide-binding protein subunit gamma [Basidiobolus meristosporus CBS 931.73]